VKTDEGVLSKDQQEWHAAAKRMRRNVCVVRSIAQALAVRSLPAEYVGAAPTVGGLAGRWAVPGTGYRAAIVGVMERMRSV
jgi:hypothetical protein